jgi:hypothetical protein
MTQRDQPHIGTSVCAELLRVTPEWIESAPWDNDVLQCDRDLARDLSKAIGVTGASATDVMRSRTEGRQLLMVTVGRRGHMVIVGQTRVGANDADIRVAVTPSPSRIDADEICDAFERYMLRVTDCGSHVH